MLHPEEKAMNIGTTVTRMKSSHWMLCVLLFLIITAACSAGSIVPTEARDDSFAVGESPRVIVSSSNGYIIINSGADGVVRVQTTIRKPDDLDYVATQEGNTIRVEADEKDSGIFNFGESPGADIEITAPSNTRVELRTINGSVEVYGMHQSGTVRTTNGSILMDDVTGKFNVSTTSGTVAIRQASGTFDVKNINGRIEFDGEVGPGGNNRMTTVNGSVEIKLQGTPSVEIDASTRNGFVTTRLPILTTSPGDERHLVGTIGAGDAELFVRTSNGSVMIQ